MLARAITTAAAALVAIGLLIAAFTFLTGAFHLYLLSLPLSPPLAALIVALTLIGLAVLVVAAARFAGRRAHGRHPPHRPGAIAQLGDLAAREAAEAAEAHPYGVFTAAFVAGLVLGGSAVARDVIKMAMRMVDGAGLTR